jgi:N-acetylglucosamine kinase-like BadF-type ATPase
VRLYVQNDAVAALASGTMGKLHGCVLIAGTGSIAYGFTEDGKEARAAGAGPVLGDWGRLSLATISLSGLIIQPRPLSLSLSIPFIPLYTLALFG